MFHSPFSALITLASVGVANAWFRVSCTDPLVQERLDPIISPGGNPSQHVHTIHGASNFNPTYSFENLRASNCTNCLVTQDLSNYWFPKLYFQDPKTKLFEPVANGGLLVYYQNPRRRRQAFPPGLRMIAGDPKRRSKKFAVGLGTQEELCERAVQWSCLRFTAGLPGYVLNLDPDDNGTGFPTKNCESGLNSRLHSLTSPLRSAPRAGTESTWTPQTTSPTSMAYLSGLDNGSCPSGFIYMMKLFFEITWNVNDFTARWTPGTDKWPFVYATGDPTGFSWHGDFQNGWDVTALQNAIDNCNNPNDDTGSGVTEACRFLTVKSAALANTCKIAPLVKEVINGTLAKLPGCNPLQFGPQDATIFNDANCPATLLPSTQHQNSVLFEFHDISVHKNAMPA
ncbi:hypothetical protein B0H14DRAFT_2558007 [Mycena olivaceomarginata]|nr:hypothetical protein B0H14DRAFT_2558007 [Mycena olivaceomarginata]